MTEVANNSYGQFMDMVEDFTFPSSVSCDDLTQAKSPKTSSSFDLKKASFAAKLFYAMERANLPLVDSTESLASISSCGSMSSLKSTSGADLTATEQFYDALQTLTINNFNSSPDLMSEEEKVKSILNTIQAAIPSFLLNFVASYDEFMHNFDASQEEKSSE